MNTDRVVSGYVPSNPDSKPTTNPFVRVALHSPGRFAVDEPVVLALVLRNESSEPQRICTVFTPFEERERFRLELRDAAGTTLVPKTNIQPGPMPGPADHRTLAAGEGIEAKIDLRADYELAPGHYTARFIGHPFVNHLADSLPHPFQIEERGSELQP